MPELETLIRAAAPRPTRAPAELERTIWAAASTAAPTEPAQLTEPELSVGEPLPIRRGGRLRPLVGIAAAAAILLAAVAVAGLRDHRSQPAAGHGPAASTATPKAGRYYVDNT